MGEPEDPGISLARAIGHELNNPLTSALLDVAEALDASGVPPGVEVRLRSIAVALGRLRSLAAELQLLASPVDGAPHDLAEICRRVSGIVPHEAVELRVAPVTVGGDGARLHQLVFSMVNAMHRDRLVMIECSDDGGPVVRVTGRREIAIDAVRADLVGATRGERFAVELPSNLPERIARTIGADWIRQPVGDETMFEAKFPKNQRPEVSRLRASVKL